MFDMKTEILFLMGITWSGKTTLLDTSEILHHDAFTYVQSLTTRALRPWEVNGKKYRHISPEEFETYIYNGDMLEYAVVHQIAHYGTKLSDILAPATQWKIAIKEIETKWLIKIHEWGKIEWRYATIFLDIPEDILKERLQERWTTDPEELKRRIVSSYHERKHAKQYCDYIINASWTKEEVAISFWNTIKKIFPSITIPEKFISDTTLDRKDS